MQCTGRAKLAWQQGRASSAQKGTERNRRWVAACCCPTKARARALPLRCCGQRLVARCRRRPAGSHAGPEARVCGYSRFTCQTAAPLVSRFPISRFPADSNPKLASNRAKLATKRSARWRSSCPYASPSCHVLLGSSSSGGTPRQALGTCGCYGSVGRVHRGK